MKIPSNGPKAAPADLSGPELAQRLRKHVADAEDGAHLYGDALDTMRAAADELERRPPPVAEVPPPCSCRVPIAVQGQSFARCGRPCAPGEATCSRHRRAVL